MGPASLSKLSDSLREQGYRLTLQREIIIEAVEAVEGHISVDDIYQQVHPRFPQVNLSTIYRTLELLEQAGLVGHSHFHDGVTKWHRAGEGHHQHLICERCGAESELELSVVAPLATEIRERYGFAANLGHFAITGICQSCLRKGEQPHHH
jgi:Fur family ferric uptake transcriptional regulator